MLANLWAVGRHTCGHTIGHIEMVYVTKGNIHPKKFMQTHSQIGCIKIMAKAEWQTDDKVIFCSVVPNFDILLHITGGSWSNYYWLAILHNNTIKPNEYTCYF